MEALIIELAKKYGMEKAMQLLGLDEQEQNPKYTFGMPFTNNKVSINPMKMVVNQGIKTLMGGSKMGMAVPLIAGGLGLAYLRNPLRQGSMNYNPYLKDQMTYLSENNMLGTDQSGLTKYGTDSILSGQNVVSMFGTNDYLDQLNKYKSKYKNTMPKNRLDKLNKEIADYELAKVNKELEADQLKTLKNINANTTQGDNKDDSGKGGGFNEAAHNAGKASAAAQEQSNRDFARGRFNQGGIASL